MSLRGVNSGGFSSPIFAGFDDTRDLTVLVKLRRGGTQGVTDTVLRLLSAGRTRGVSIVTGGGAGTGGTANDLFAVCGAGTTTNWGSSANHGGRGLGAAGGVSATDFDSIVVVVRGSAAADNSGTGGAQQIHEIWRNGTFGTVGAAASSVIVGTVGERINYLHRDGSTTVYFDGWLADVTVWQDWRPDAAAYARIGANEDPRAIGPAPRLFRSLRSVLAAEVGDTVLTAAGTAPAIDAAVNPPAYAAPSLLAANARLPQSAGASVLTSNNPAPTVQPPTEDAEIVSVGGSAVTGSGMIFTVRLAPDNQPDITPGWVNIVARVTVRGGTNVRIEADLSTHQSGLHGPNSGWCYRPAEAVGVGGFMACAGRVLTADTGIIGGDLPVDAADRTWLVALQPVWKEANYAGWFAELRTRSHVHEAASVAAARGGDPSLPANAHARVSPGPRTQANSVPAADAYMLAVRITDTGAAPASGKVRAVLVQGQHASEHQGDHAAHEFADWLTRVQAGAAETLRQALLERFDFHVYNGNPLGRRYGKERWTEEQAGDEDPNRSWDDSGSSQINAVKAAIAVDTAGAFGVLFDFHGAQSRDTASWNTAFMLFPAAGESGPSAFRSAVTAKLGGIGVSADAATGEFAQGYALARGAVVAETLEYAMGGPGFFAAGGVAISYGVPNGAVREVLNEMFAAGAFGAALAPAAARQPMRGASPALGVAGLVTAASCRMAQRAGSPMLALPGMPAIAALYTVPVRIEPRTLRAGL